MMFNRVATTLTERPENIPSRGTQAVLGGGAGMYDGLFGPGTGSFLILFLVRWGGMDFVRASAAAKAINLATNSGALGFFVFAHSLEYSVGLPMAVCNVLGAWIGSSMAGRFGPRLVRGVLFTVVAALCFKLLVELFLGS